MDDDDQKIYTVLHIGNANLWLNYICDVTILRYNTFRPPKMPRNIHATSSMPISINDEEPFDIQILSVAPRRQTYIDYWCAPEVQKCFCRFTEKVVSWINRYRNLCHKCTEHEVLITNNWYKCSLWENLQYLRGAPS